MRFTVSIIALAALSGVIASPIKSTARDIETREDAVVKADIIYPIKLYKREEKSPKADIIYPIKLYKKEEESSKADLVYPVRAYKREEEKLAKADYLYRDVYKN